MASSTLNYPKQLKTEAEDTAKRRDQILLDLQAQIDTLKHEMENIAVTPGASQKQAQQTALNIKKLNTAAIKGVKEEMANLKKMMGRADQFEYQNYKKNAEAWFKKAQNVCDTSKKNKLYLGNRQYVTSHALQNNLKEQRYLNAGVWSWGVNLAWIEGGIDADVVFKIKFHASDKFSGFPPGSWADITASPRMRGPEWLTLCEKYPGSMLWQDAEARPTWFAYEVKAALDAGYHFEVGYSKKTGDEKLILTT